MKFKTTPYHFDLLKDEERLSAFYEAIKELSTSQELAYDLGCGSGILSFFLNSYFKEIIAIEQDFKASGCAKENLKSFKNIEVVNEDVLKYDFSKKCDLIVCEMLDTALIDEEEVPVLNHARNYLKENGKIIPQGIINTIELAHLERDYIHYDEDVNCKTLSKPVIYDEINFLNDINPDFEKVITIKANKDSLVNGLKITTITKLNDNLVCGPTPMLNPPLLIPLDEKNVKCNDLINVKLKYIMGKGIGDFISFKRQLEEFLENNEKLIILGIGNELKCDDGVGPFIINELKDLENSNLIIIDGKTVPENFTGKIRKEQPSHVILVDACLMGCKPGEFKIVDNDDFVNIGISTHSMSLSYFVKYLGRDNDFKIIFVGIEPESMDYSDKPTPAVQKGAYKFINILKEIL